MSDLQRRWDMWHLKTLFPTWSEQDREDMLQAAAVHDGRQQAMFGDPQAARERFGPKAERVLRDHPGLATGLTISLHLGPYSLAPVPWLIAGRDIHVLVNRTSLAEIRPIYDTLQAELDLPGRVRWVPIEGRGFALRLLRTLRRNQPVFAFLDGNDGLDGCEGTLRDGIVHHLPGRDIRVRTGLARLALRLGSPVHSLVTVWDDAGSFDWHRGPTWRWPVGTDPAAATGELFTWAFGVIRRHPSQWRVWNMLTGVCDSFRSADPAATTAQLPADPWWVLAAMNRDRRLAWRRPAVVWPGDMLEDVQGQCFYAAHGITADELAWLEGARTFTPAEVERRLGREWVQGHLPRLVALGMVAPASRSGCAT